jgi:hypothetical protein
LLKKGNTDSPRPFLVFQQYVDHLFLKDEKNLITDYKKKISSKFEIKDLGPMHYFLGLEVWKNPEDIFLIQGKYVVEILKRLDMMDYRTMSTPMEMNLKLFVDTLYRHMIGSLMYLMNTRPYI